MLPRGSNIAKNPLSPWRPAVGVCAGFRLVLVLFLTLALVIAGGSRAMAFAHPQGAEALVICADGGAKTIYLDVGGSPVGPSHDCSKCPECMHNPVFLPANMAIDPTLSLIRVSGGVRPAESLVLPSHHLRPQSRGPPLFTLVWNDATLPVVRSPFGPKLLAGPGGDIERASKDARS